MPLLLSFFQLPAGKLRREKKRVFVLTIFFVLIITVFYFYLNFLKGVVNEKRMPSMTRKIFEKIWIPRSQLLEAFLERINKSN